MEKTDQAEFYRRAEGFINRFLEEAPVAATQLGDHRFDDRLGDYSKEALERQQREVQEALAGFESFDEENFELDARHPDVSLKELHDAILSCGSLPPRLMRERLFED